MKKILLMLSIILLNIVVFAQNEMKVNRDINLLNNNIFNADTIHTMQLKLNYKDLDSLIDATNFGATFNGDSVILGKTGEVYSEGYIYLSDGFTGGVTLLGATDELLINGVAAATETTTDSLAEDIAALSGYATWDVDSVSLELSDITSPPQLRIIPSYIAQYELVSTNNVKLALKANLASPTFTGYVSIPSPFYLGGVEMQTNATRLNYLRTASGSTGLINSNLVFSNGPTFTGNVVLPSTTYIGASISPTELGYLDGVTSAIQTQFSGRASNTLDNLGTTAINANLIPAADNTLTFGSFGKSWSGIFTQAIFFEDPELWGTIFAADSTPTGLRMIYLPDASGTVALREDTYPEKFCFTLDSLQLAKYSTTTVFRTSRAITGDSVFCITRGTSPSVSFQLHEGTDITSVASMMSPYAVTSVTTGHTTGSLGDVAANRMIWCGITAIANTPKELMICIYYH